MNNSKDEKKSHHQCPIYMNTLFHKGVLFKPALFISFLFSLIFSYSVNAKQDIAKNNAPPPTILPSNPVQHYDVKTQRTLIADGYNKGRDTYQLIKDFGGKKPIEAPDLYDVNHPGKPHIYEAYDDKVGDHFVFTLHKNEDKDRNVLSKTDRQRNEIKAYSGSEKALKGYQNETMTYSWKFKLNKDITLSKNFGHFFQLKAVDDGPGSPLLTISGRDKRGERLEVIHTNNAKLTLLKKVPLLPLKGKWLQVSCFVHYHDEGQLELLITDLSNNDPETNTVLHLSLDNIDLWRGTKDKHFVRPKWGFYRSLRSKDMLRDEEEKVFFADFIVQKLKASPLK